MRNTNVRFRTFASLSGLALLPCAETALAQGNGEPVTEISFDLSGVYEDNIARSSDLLSQQRGLNRSDFIVTPSVSINISRQIGSAQVSVAGQLGYVFHAKNKDLNRERIGVSARAEVPVGPCQISPEVSLQRRQSELSEIVFLPPGGTGSIKNTQTVQSYGVTIGCGRDPGLQPYGGVTYERADNSSLVRERAEYSATTYRGGLRYNSAALGEISLYGSRKVTDASALAAPPGTNNDYRFDEIGAEFRRDIGSRIKATASVGYGKLTGDSAFIDGFSGLTWNLELSALVGASLRLTASTGREVGNSLASDAGFVVSTPHRARLEYAFSDRARLDAGVAIIERRFGYSTAPVLNAITDENRKIFDGGFSYTLGNRINLRLFGGHERRNANGTIFDYRASFAGASIGFRF